MNSKKIYLSSPHMGGKEQELVKATFDSNWIAPLGANVDGFENDLCQYTGAQNAAVLTSGTAALHLALILLDVKPNDLVICQSLTFSASANPITYLGATPVFVDSESDTWNMCPTELEKAIIACINGDIKTNGNQKAQPQKPKAIIPVHLYGMPAQMDKIIAIANKYEIPIIEDAAESLGSTYHGKQTGTFGKMSILSFNGNKIITTSGGGALLSDNEQLVCKARFLATQARDPAPHYQHSQIGYNYRMSNVLAAIGRGQMIVLPDRIAQRRKVFDWYQNYFNNIRSKGYSVIMQPEPTGCFSNRWLTAIYIDPKENKGIDVEKVRLGLHNDNIEARPIWKPMHKQPIFEKSPFFGNRTAERLFENGLCLPSGSNLVDEDFERIYNSLEKLFY